MKEWNLENEKDYQKWSSLIEEPYSCPEYKNQTWKNCNECCIRSIQRITEYLLHLKEKAGE